MSLFGSNDKSKLYDKAFWYVINKDYKHIVYRSKNIEKALQYAERKNKQLTNNQINNMEYCLMSGQELITEQISSIGYLSSKNRASAA